jgi:hypothetical protein
MKRVYEITAIAAFFFALPSAWSAESASKQIAARTELYQVQTLTLSDQQFLTGDGAGKPMTVTGQFRIAQRNGRLPVVVLQHGSAGFSANVDSGRESSMSSAYRHSFSTALPVAVSPR